MKICNNLNMCTGCSACANICTYNAIRMLPDEKGFYRPIIDKNICVSCGACAKVCQVNLNTVSPFVYKTAYAVAYVDSFVLEQSSSGGAFTALADYVFQKDGIVFGCGWNENNTAQHFEIESHGDLNKLRGSKYVQSFIGDTYKRIKSYLKCDRYVLFTGTPCQVAGLKAYLNKDYDKLICVDLICHGVPSAKLFKSYLNSLGSDNSKMTIVPGTIKFRDKKNTSWGMHFTYQEGDRSVSVETCDNWYFSLFLWGYTYQQSCYSCKYAGSKRVGDFTIGDYFAICKMKNELSDKNGVSILICNTCKSIKIMDDIVDNFNWRRLSDKEVLLGNAQLTAPTKNHVDKSNYIYSIMNKKGYSGIEQYYKRGKILRKVKSCIRRIIRGQSI